MFKTILLLVLTNVVLYASGQEDLAGKVSFTADLSNIKELPLKVVIEKSGLGGLEGKPDTLNAVGRILKFETHISEPELLRITFYWPRKKLTSTSLWVVPSSYQLKVTNDLVATLLNSPTDFASRISKLENEVRTFNGRSESLVKLVNFRGKKLEDVENRIHFIRDSIDTAIDNTIYKQEVLDNPGSPVGLYALCQYAERPFVNQRIKSQPDDIAILLNKLDARIRQLPSAKTLAVKLTLGEQMAIGKAIKDISLPDTAGKLFKVGDFKGKYLLIEFWASWCTPCRAESPQLIKAFNKYKNSGFQIISVTRDNISLKADWLKAIAQDRVNLWPQLSDFDDVAQKAYGIRFIPANYLIDPNGVIIARDLRGAELEDTLTKTLK
jgi:peroxiredoxin